MPFSGRVPSMVPGSGQGCGRGGSDGSGWHVHGSGKGVRRVHAVALGGGLVLAMGFAGIALASSANRPPTPPPAQGEITAITGGVLTIKGTGSKTETVDTTSATVVRAGPGPQGKASSVSALKVGDRVAVQGSESNGVVTATAIMVGPAPAEPPAPPSAQGEITAITGGVLTIKGPGSKIETVDTTSATVVRAGPGPQGKASSVSALKVGEGVAVFGNHSGNAIEATAIWEMPRMPGGVSGLPGLPLGPHAPKTPLNVQSTSR